MKKENLESLLLQVMERWWLRFCSKHDQDVQYGTLIRNSDCFRHFGMHCGLTRDETKKLAHVFQKLGWLRVERSGWRILSPPQEVVGNA